jgi:iron complex transport system substrate-binding protein
MRMPAPSPFAADRPAAAASPLASVRARMRRVGLRVATGGLLALASGGCGDSAREPAAARTAQSAPQRIVCGSPAVAEIVFALDCGPQVVGVSDYTVYPPEAQKKAGIGGWHNPNRERILTLESDLVVTQGRHETLADFCDRHAIAFRSVQLDSLADIEAAIATLAAVLQVPERGAALQARMRRELESVRQAVATRPRRRVLLLFGRNPGDLSGLATTGPDTFLDEMITLAGGSNIFSDATGPYPQISKESLLIREPQAILELHPGGLPADAAAQLRRDWQRLNTLPAVAADHIVVLTDDFLLMPGPRAGLIARAFAAAIHPELENKEASPEGEP